MKKIIIAVGIMSLMLSVSSVTGEKVFASEDKQTAAVATPGANDKDERKAKLEATLKKWETLPAEKKNEAYKILEERLNLDGKLLDQLAVLGVMDKEEADRVKSEMKQRFTEMKADGKFPIRRYLKPKKPSCDHKQDIMTEQQ